MKYEIKTRFTGAAQFTAEIEADDGASRVAKVGLAVKWAVKNDADLSGADLSGADLSGADLSDADLRGANLRGAYLSDANLRGAYLSDADLGYADLSDADLRGANLRGADLSDANLRGAYLSDADLVDGGQRSDGYRFVGWIKDDVLQIRAGCRNFTIDEARAHWSSSEYRDETLGKEALLILDRIEGTAMLRGLVR